MEVKNLSEQLEKALFQSGKWQNFRLGNLFHVASGWESEIFAFDFYANSASNVERFVLRIYPGQNAGQKAVVEFNALSQLHAAGYPVPRPVLLEIEHLLDEMPFILMEYIAGERIWGLFGNLTIERIHQLLDRIAQLQANLHQLDWRQFTDERPTDPFFWLDGWLAQMKWAVDEYRILSFLPALDWLKDHCSSAPCNQPAPIHWDFHPDNVLLCPNESLVVVDWTQFQVSDPRFDLAWSMLLIGSYENENMSAAYLNSYEKSLGKSVEALDYFIAAAIFKRLGSVYISLTQSPEQMGMRSGAVDSMRTHFPVFRRMYAHWQDLTRVPIPAIENLLAE